MGAFKSIAFLTLVLGLALCQIVEDPDTPDSPQFILNPESVTETVEPQESEQDSYRLCMSKERKICRLSPSKYEEFIAGQMCALLLFEVNPISEVKRILRGLRKRFKDIPAKCFVGWVDLTLEPSFAQTHPHLPNFIALYSSNHDGFLEYDGKLSDLAIFRWAIKTVFDIVHTVTTKEEIESFEDLKSYGLLVNPSGNQELKDSYHAFCRKIQDLNFIETSSDELAHLLETGDDPTLFVISPYANRTERMVLENGVLDEAKALRFVQDKRRTDVFNTSMSFDKMLKWKEPIVARIKNGSALNDTKFLDFGRRFNGIENVGEDPAHTAVLDGLLPKGFIMDDLWVNFYELTDSTNIGRWFQYFVGREETTLEEDWVLIIQKESDQYKKWYLPTWDFTTLLKALRDLRDGKLAPYIKSQKEAAQEKPPMVGLTSDTLESEVIQKPGSALVIGYSPRCGFCVEGRQIMQKIATEFEGTPNFRVYEMDVTENDHPSFHIESYPKVMFYQDGDKMDPEIFEVESFGKIEEFLEKKGIISPKKTNAGEL
jgi:hypothetical protein